MKTNFSALLPLLELRLRVAIEPPAPSGLTASASCYQASASYGLRAGAVACVQLAVVLLAGGVHGRHTPDIDVSTDGQRVTAPCTVTPSRAQCCQWPPVLRAEQTTNSNKLFQECHHGIVVRG